MQCELSIKHRNKTVKFNFNFKNSFFKALHTVLERPYNNPLVCSFGPYFFGVCFC